MWIYETVHILWKLYFCQSLFCLYFTIAHIFHLLLLLFVASSFSIQLDFYSPRNKIILHFITQDWIEWNLFWKTDSGKGNIILFLKIFQRENKWKSLLWWIGFLFKFKDAFSDVLRQEKIKERSWKWGVL